MTAYSSTLYASAQGAATGHGPFQVATHLHAIVTVPATAATGDTLNFGYIPANAIVDQVTLKAATQLDSKGSPTLTLSLGTVASPTLFSNALTTVGRAAGASADVTIAAAGRLYKTTAKTAIIGTLTAGPATGVAGTVELDMEYFVEDTVGSPA